MNQKDFSSVKLTSNIMLKSRYEKDFVGYLPPDLLPKEYSDVRNRSMLTARQQEQLDKRLFYASKIIDK